MEDRSATIRLTAAAADQQKKATGIAGKWHCRGRGELKASEVGVRENNLQGGENNVGDWHARGRLHEQNQANYKQFGEGGHPTKKGR